MQQAAKTSRTLSPDRAHWRGLLEEAVREVFAMMLNTEIQPAPPGTEAPKAEFTAMVGLAGALCACCSQVDGFADAGCRCRGGGRREMGCRWRSLQYGDGQFQEQAARPERALHVVLPNGHRRQRLPMPPDDG